MDSTVCEAPLACPSCDIFGQLARDRTLFLCEDIDVVMSTALVAQLLWLEKHDPEAEITIYINSSGGTISNGLMTIYDTLQYIKTPIKTICIGEAHSGAAIILASGTKGKRLSYQNAEIMIHAVQVSNISGSQTEVEKESKRLKILNQSLMELISKHTGQSLTKIKKDCQEDKYFTAKEALDYGLIDAIIKPHKKVTARKK